MINKALHYCQKKDLWGKIKRLGTIYGEQPSFIEDYAKDVYRAYADDLAYAINSFQDLITQAEWIYPKWRK